MTKKSSIYRFFERVSKTCQKSRSRPQKTGGMVRLLDCCLMSSEQYVDYIPDISSLLKGEFLSGELYTTPYIYMNAALTAFLTIAVFFTIIATNLYLHALSLAILSHSNFVHSDNNTPCLIM